MTAVFADVSWPERQWRRANILIDETGSVHGPGGTSATLTRGRDRELLRQIRADAEVVITSGMTVRNEGWFFPTNGTLAVLTQTNELPIDSCPHPDRLVTFHELASLFDFTNVTATQRILSEAGPTLLKLLLEQDFIDELFVSVTFAPRSDVFGVDDHAEAIARHNLRLDSEKYLLTEIAVDDDIAYTRFLRRRVTNI